MLDRDEIIKIALEAGLPEASIEMTPVAFERFAALIAAEEREKVARWMIRRGYATGHGDSIEDLLQELDWQIREQEREACAKPKGDLVCVCGAVWEGDLMVHAPIQRKPLTEPELHEINPTWPAPGQQWDYEDVLAFVRAVEVKLKEKNHG